MKIKDSKKRDLIVEEFLKMKKKVSCHFLDRQSPPDPGMPDPGMSDPGPSDPGLSVYQPEQGRKG